MLEPWDSQSAPITIEFRRSTWAGILPPGAGSGSLSPRLPRDDERIGFGESWTWRTRSVPLLTNGSFRRTGVEQAQSEGGRISPRIVVDKT